MGSIFGKLLTAYSLYTLTGPGLVVVYFVLSCWYIQGNFGWIALGIYVVVWWIIAECIISAIANWIRKSSIFCSQEAWEKHRNK